MAHWQPGCRCSVPTGSLMSLSSLQQDPHLAWSYLLGAKWATHKAYHFSLDSPRTAPDTKNRVENALGWGPREVRVGEGVSTGRVIKPVVTVGAWEPGEQCRTL